MCRYLKCAVIRGFAFVLAFADAVEHVLLVNLLSESLAGELLDISLQRRYAEHLPARKPIADGTSRKALKKALLASEIHVNSDDKHS